MNDKSWLTHLDRMDFLYNLTGGLTHDINNPLGVISLSLSMIESIIEGPEDEIKNKVDKLKKYLTNIDQSIEKTRDIFDFLVIFTKHEDNIKNKSLSCEDFSKGALIFTKHKIRANDISIEVENGEGVIDTPFISELFQCLVYMIYDSVEQLLAAPTETPPVINLQINNSSKGIEFHVSNNFQVNSKSYNTHFIENCKSMCNTIGAKIETKEKESLKLRVLKLSGLNT